MTPRIVAVDWSGAKRGGGRKNAIAEASAHGVVTVEDGLTRQRIVEQLIEVKRSSERALIGLDFGFSMPSWYLAQQGFDTAPAFWQWLAVGNRADELLSECVWPFWGRKGSVRPELDAAYRETELKVEAVQGIRPKSVFQINGPGTVGTGSIRGMRALHELRVSGFAVWPFDDQASHTVVEIYPRLLTGPVTKSKLDARMNYLSGLSGCMDDLHREIPAGTEDAFDATVSALKMFEHLDELSALPPIADPQLRLEGIIWHPEWRETLSVQAG